MKDVLDSYDRVSLEFIGNSNSLHELGLNSKRIEEAASRQILDVLGLDDYDVIYTSGNSESFSTILFNCSGNVYSDAIDVLYICDLMGVPVSSDDVYLFSTRDEVMIDARYKHIDIDLDMNTKNELKSRSLQTLACRRQTSVLKCSCIDTKQPWIC